MLQQEGKNRDSVVVSKSVENDGSQKKDGNIRVFATLKQNGRQTYTVDCWLMTVHYVQIILLHPLVHYFNTLKPLKHLKHSYMFRHKNSWSPHNTQPEPFQPYSDYRYATT